MKATSIAEQIEAIIDANTLSDVLTAITTICGVKADHLQTNWQDTSAAAEWNRAGRRIETALNNILKTTHL